MAWAFLPNSENVNDNGHSYTRWNRIEAFNCQELCRSRKESELGKLDKNQQNSYNCTLVTANEKLWKIKSRRDMTPVYMGLPPDYSKEGVTKDWQKPLEDIVEEGCPGGWYRCEFVRSLSRYRRSGSDNKIENIFLSRCQDRFVIEAIHYLEDEERQSLNDFYEVKNA